MERFAGTGAVEGQPPFPVHLELRREGEVVTGAFTSAAGTYPVVRGRASGTTVSGGIEGEGATGEFTLRIEGDDAAGSFSLGPARGTLTLRRTTASAAEALGPPPQNLSLTPAQWQEDLAALIRILTTEHGAPFHHVREADFRRAARGIAAATPRSTGPEIAAAFRRLSMMIGDGHTGVALPARQPRFPLRTFWFDDGIGIVATLPEHRALLGARVRAVGGVPIGEVLRRLRPYSPMNETEWSYRAVLPALINRPHILEAAGIARGGRVAWTFAMPDGGRRTVMLDAGEFPIVGRALLGGGPPLWERRPDEPFWMRQWPASGTLYVNFRGYRGLAANAAALGRALDEMRPLRLVIDMRDNGGGDYTLGRELLIPEIVRRPWINRRGALYVLVGRYTFSAAMVNAADFRSMTQAILVGEPIGEKPNSWQESRRFYLPNSGLPVGVSTLFYRFAPEGVEAIEPDIYAPPTLRDWARGDDPAMAAVWREVFRRSLRTEAQ